MVWHDLTLYGYVDDAQLRMPEARCGHSLTVLRPGMAVLFGGALNSDEEKKVALNDFWLCEYETTAESVFEPFLKELESLHETASSLRNQISPRGGGVADDATDRDADSITDDERMSPVTRMSCDAKQFTSFACMACERVCPFFFS